ncbi:glycosyltransferase [Microbacterium suwonense]|uniref:Glycosyltransferase 2-like domain-containing protein n=1 Tax=Microbacterium suwonense TaxID=683047 RepID=A0ABN6X385_9MICO|nr:glycosyltransferase [Microbacterium suwonense]BDZ39172.1 hypothetical protein GCM10025863_17860 [Microbacterium suwonense]
MSTPLSGGNRPGGYAGGDAEPARQEHDLAEYEHDLAVVGTSVRRSSIGCVIPAHDDEATIAAVLTSLLQQTRVPDVIHVIVHGTSDGTVPAASVFAGPHEIVTGLGEQFTEVFVHDIGANPGQQIGALNYGYSLVEGYDFLLVVDGDAVGDAHAVEHLEAHAVSDTRIGGILAIRSIDRTRATGILPRLLLTAQRSRLAAATLQNLLPGRSTAMLGGQFSLLSITALRAVMDAGRLRTPGRPAARRPDHSCRCGSTAPASIPGSARAPAPTSVA